jgi:hypothetical protein
MNMTNRQQLMAIIAGAGLALVVADNLVFSPLVKSWETRSAQVADLKKSVSRGTMLLGSEKTIRARWELMRTNALSGNMSAAEDQVVKAFDRWRAASRVNITSIHPQPQGRRSANDLLTLECRADAAGSLTDLTRFLYELDKDPLAVKVDLVELTAHDKEGKQLTLGLQVSGLLINPPGN